MTAPATPAGRIVLPVKLRRLQRLEFLRGLMEQGPAAATLLAAGLQGLGAAGANRALAVVEVMASSWILLLLARAARRLAGRGDDAAPVAALAEDALPAEMEGVDWTGLAAAALIAVEVWHRWQQTGHVVRPFVLSAVFTFAMAVGGRRLVARRLRPRLGHRAPRLVLSTEGFDYRASRRRHLAARWSDVAEVVELSPEAVHLRLHDGRELALRARDHVQGAGLVAAVRDVLPRYAPDLMRN